MPAIHVPPARDNDRDTLARQVQTVNDACLAMMAYDDEYYDRHFKSGSEALVDVRDGQPVGAVMYRQDGDGMYIQTLGVIPAYEGRKVATGLVARVLATAAARGVVRVALDVRETNRRARSLYTRLGFRATHNATLCYPELTGQDRFCIRMVHGGHKVVVP